MPAHTHARSARTLMVSDTVPGDGETAVNGRGEASAFRTL